MYFFLSYNLHYAVFVISVIVIKIIFFDGVHYFLSLWVPSRLSAEWTGVRMLGKVGESEERKHCVFMGTWLVQ